MSVSIEEFVSELVAHGGLVTLLSWLQAAPVYESLVTVVATALGDRTVQAVGGAGAVLMEALTQTNQLPCILFANLKNLERSPSVVAFLGLLVERANKTKLSCVLFEHVFSTELIEALVGVASGGRHDSDGMPDCAAPKEALELLCWLMRTSSDASLLERHSPKNARLMQREAAHGLAKTYR